MHATVIAVATVVAGLGTAHIAGDGGNEETVHTGREVPAFDRLDVSGVFEVDLEVGPAHSLLIHGDPDDLEHVRSRVRDGELQVSYEGHKLRNRKLRLTVTAPRIKALDLSGVVRARARGFDGGKLFVDMSGATRLSLQGRVQELAIDVSGAARVSADDLVAREVKIDASGAARLEVHALEALSVDSSGASKVTYYGRPERVSTDVSGAARVRPARGGGGGDSDLDWSKDQIQLVH